MDPESIPPSLPFRLAAAYGAPVSGARTSLNAQSGSGVPRVLADTDTVELSLARHAAPATPGASRLIAARVDVQVDFGLARRPAPDPQGALAMYRHPADKNAAATAVNVGRSVDLTG